MMSEQTSVFVSYFYSMSGDIIWICEFWLVFIIEYELVTKYSGDFTQNSNL
jgi:hypothetical protein